MKFLLFCSGADVEILLTPECRTERCKYAMIGIFILFTAFLAFISGSYALYTIFKSKELAITIGSVYALMIFTLDRFIVSTTRKEKGRNWQQFMNALVRILMAAFIALVITMPLETKIFESAIARQIAEENTVAAIAAQEKLDQGFPRLKQLEQENQKLLAELKTEQQRRDAAYKESMEENEGTNGTLKPGKGPVYAEKRQEFEARNSRFMEVERRINQQVSENRQKIQSLEADKDKQYQSINKANEDSSSFLIQMSALHRLAKKDSMIEAASNAIRLMFITLDVAPILAKLLSKRGPYDAMLARVGKEVIEREDRKSEDIQYGIDLESQYSKDKEKLMQGQDWAFFQATQQFLSKQLSDIQVKALETEEWKSVVNEAVSSYVKSLKHQLDQYARSFDLTPRELKQYIRPIFVNKAKKYADLTSEDELNRRRVNKSQNDFVKSSHDYFAKMMRKWK